MTTSSSELSGIRQTDASQTTPPDTSLDDLKPDDQPIGEPQPEGKPTPHPFHRYFARSIDSLAYFALLLALLFAWSFFCAACGTPWNPPESTITWFCMAITLFFLAEVGCLSLWGTTPGKALYRIRIRHHGERIRGGTVWKRTLRLHVFGLWFSIPILVLIPILRQFYILSNKGNTSYDLSGDLHVEHLPFGRWRWFVIVPLILLSHTLFTLGQFA